MWEEQEDFPRGRESLKKPDEKNDKENKKWNTEKPSKKRKFADNNDDVIFNEKKAKRRKVTEQYNLDEIPLNQQSLVVGLTVLGCVRQTQDYSVSLDLPGSVVTILPITSISKVYSDQLQRLVDNDDSTVAEEIKPVSEWLPPGTIIPVVVKEIVEQKGTDKRSIKVSCIPAELASSKSKSAVKNGMLLYGCVSSIEDHGYQVDIGIKGIRAFLPKKDSVNFLKHQENGLFEGQTLWCVVQMKGTDTTNTGECRVVNVTVDPDVIKKSKIPESSQMNTLSPGSKVKAQISEVKDHGLAVTFQDFEGFIHVSHLPRSTSSYSINSKLQASILYVHPESKMIHLTALPHINQMNGLSKNIFGDLKVGDKFKAKVSRAVKKKGLYLQLPKDCTGFAAMKQLTDKSSIPDITEFTVGSKHQCRVLNFNYLEALALVSLKESVLDEKYLTVADIVPGSLVEGVVKDVNSLGVAVKLSKRIFSFIPCAHLADVPIKHPEKKFDPGMTVKGRVLSVDASKSRVKLTLKTSFVKPKYPIITDYNQLKRDMTVEGTIINVKQKCIIIGFCNEVKGYVLSNDMSTESVSDPSSMFQNKQVVKCRVISCKPEEKKLRLSFNFGEKVKKEKKVKEKVIVESLGIGQVAQAKIISVLRDGFKVLLMPNGGVAKLPFDHLSDHTEVQELQKSSFQTGDILDKVTPFKTEVKTTIVTMKESFIRAAEEGKVAKKFGDLEIGMLLPAVIVRHKEFGIFMELAGGYAGLCPSKMMSYLKLQKLEELFLVGQSVMTRVRSIQKEKRRFLGNLRGDECHEDEDEEPILLLKDFLHGRERAMKILSEKDESLHIYKNLSVGSVVELSVTSVHGKGVLGELESGAKALVTKDHFGMVTPKPGEKYKAVVLHFDALTPCLELSLDKKLIKAIALDKHQKNQARPEQVIKADLLLTKPDFMLMCLRGHAFGHLVYVPAKKYLNDVELKTAYKPGMFSDVVIKEYSEVGTIGVLKMHDKKLLAKESASKGNLKHIPSHNVEIGDIVEAKIKSVHHLQINFILSTGKASGRVHITEVADDPKMAQNPVHKFQPHQNVTVKVIGLRDLKTESYLPITHPKANRTLLECSLRQSKLESKKEVKCPVTERDINIGDELTVYILQITISKIWVQVTTTAKGWIDLFHWSDNPRKINKCSQSLKVGQAFKAKVIGKDPEGKLIFSRTEHKEEIEKDDWVIGQIFGINAHEGTYVKVFGGRRGIIKGTPDGKHYIGQFLKCIVKDVSDPSMFLLAMSQARSEASETRKHQEPDKKTAKKRKRNESVSSQEEPESEPENKPKVPTPSITLPKLSIEGFSWNEDTPLKFEEEENEKAGSDDEDDYGSVEASIKTKKKSKKEQEKAIQQYEKSQLKGRNNVQSVDDFERLVLQSPNSSVVWLSYMAHHVELGEIDKARDVAEKALNTIVFREEQEKKNVWLAYLNMETLYGDTGDAKKLLSRATMYNDPLEISLKMCDIYVGAEKKEEAEQMYIILSRKYKREKAAWKAYAQYLFKMGRLQAARNLLQRCLTVLDKKDHVDVISHFAFSEFAHGDAERGRTIFENLIANYPGRTDLWSVYVDRLVKSGDIAGARQLMERAVKQKLNTKKLSFLVQKYIKFEETHGTEEQVQSVKDMAVSLFDS